MGRRELKVVKLPISKFDRGYFPNKDFDDVPDDGSADCRHVIYRRSALRPFPGMDRINSTQASPVSGQGMHYMDVLGTQARTAVFGDSFFEDVSGTWTDRTGSVVIGSGDLVQFIDHQQGANRYLIGAPGGGNSPFRWTGSGNATALGGSPPNFETMAKYHDIIFGALNEYVTFSAVGDPETWLTQYAIPFDKNVNCLLDHGVKLAVLMGDHIGSIQGYGYLDFVVEEKEIPRVGCVGKLAAKNCNWGNNDLKVIATIAKNGLWVIDESFGFQKVLGDDYFKEFNKNYLSVSSMAYWSEENLLFLALPYATSTEANYLIVVDTKTGAFWPGPNIHGNSVRALSTMLDDNGDEFVYFQDANGYAFKFNFDTNYYHTGTETQIIDYRWQSKIYDLQDVFTLGELIMFANVMGDWSVNVSIKFGLQRGDGDAGSINLNDPSVDVLGSTFTLGASILGGLEYILSGLEGVGGFGRFFQVTITRQDDEEHRSFRIRKFEINLHRQRTGGDDK